MMGCGKTTIGTALAQNLNIKFYDLDNYIEQQSKLSIVEIFTLRGEKYFRNLEKKYLNEIVAKKEDFVLA